jgi:ketosteroid isomerase-like protein
MTLFEQSPVGKEVAAAIKKYQQDLAQGNFDAVVAVQHPSATIYAPYGVLQQVSYTGNVVEDRKAAALQFKQIFEQGFRSNFFPLYIDGTVHGDAVVATFLLQGIEISPGGKQEGVVRRATNVWVKTENKWMITHIHVSYVDITGGTGQVDALL